MQSGGLHWTRPASSTSGEREAGGTVKRSDALTGSAGVYLVAAQINAMGYHAALTIRSVPNVDLLAGTLDGSRSVSIQVKTSIQASRKRGLGKERATFQYQWGLGENAWQAALESKDLVFAFVDLDCEQGESLTKLPDVFIVPTSFLRRYYRGVVKRDYGGDPSNWKWKRMHVNAQEFDQFKNNRAPLRAILG
jgi:hypothetical protein